MIPDRQMSLHQVEIPTFRLPQLEMLSVMTSSTIKQQLKFNVRELFL
jgi:hypothetical protein